MTGRKKTGAVDGGAGRGVRIGGRDSGRGPTGYDPVRSVGSDVDDEEETTPVVDDGNLDEFFEEDEDAADRRRDPLRRP